MEVLIVIIILALLCAFVARSEDFCNKSENVEVDYTNNSETYISSDIIRTPVKEIVKAMEDEMFTSEEVEEFIKTLSPEQVAALVEYTEHWKFSFTGKFNIISAHFTQLSTLDVLVSCYFWDEKGNIFIYSNFGSQSLTSGYGFNEQEWVLIIRTAKKLKENEGNFKKVIQKYHINTRRDKLIKDYCK